jgi:hypothetical protein
MRNEEAASVAASAFLPTPPRFPRHRHCHCCCGGAASLTPPSSCPGRSSPALSLLCTLFFDNYASLAVASDPKTWASSLLLFYGGTTTTTAATTSSLHDLTGWYPPRTGIGGTTLWPRGIVAWGEQDRENLQGAREHEHGERSSWGFSFVRGGGGMARDNDNKRMDGSWERGGSFIVWMIYDAQPQRRCGLWGRSYALVQTLQCIDTYYGHSLMLPFVAVAIAFVSVQQRGQWQGQQEQW